MANKPILTYNGTVTPLFLHNFPKYLPTAYDESMTIIQKLNKVIRQLNEVGELSNGLIEQWNEVMHWIVNDGLSEAVLSKLVEWYEDGTLAKIINEEIFNMKVNRSEFDLFIQTVFATLGKVQAITVITNPNDITADIQKAVNDTENGGTVFIPYGDYVMHGYVELFSDTKIVAPIGTTIRKTMQSTSSYTFIAGKTGSERGYGGGSKNIHIEGLTFKGIGQTQQIYFGNGLAFNHVENLTILNCQFIDCIYAGHAIDLAGCNNVKITDSVFKGQYLVTGREYTEAIQIDSSTPTSIGSDWGGLDALPTKDVWVERCQFVPSFTASGAFLSYAPNPIGNHGYTAGMPYENINFLNNTVIDGFPSTDAGWRGWIHFYGAKDVTISGNTFKNTRGIEASVIQFINSSGGRYNPSTLAVEVGVPTPNENIKISDNYFEGFTANTTFTLIRGYGTTYNDVVYPVNGVSITGNRFERCGSLGMAVDTGATMIQFYRSENVEVSGNEAYLGKTLASVWDANDVTITNNRGNMLGGSTVFLSNVTNAVVSGNKTKSGRRPLEIQEVNQLTCFGNVSTDVRKTLEETHANKFRNLVNANITANVTETNDSSLSYGYYVYDTAEISRNVNNHDNIADGFSVRPYNTSGTLTNYSER